MGRQSRKVITLSVVGSLGVGEVVYDAKVHGFGVRRQRANASYFVKLRVDGQQRWVTIGRHGQPTATGEVWTPDNARRRAQQIIGSPASQIGPVQCSLVSDQKLGTANAASGTSVNATTKRQRRRSVSAAASPGAAARNVRRTRASEVASPAIAQGVTMTRR